jgi:prepilin-type processing-associated H-X9-DG protein
MKTLRIGLGVLTVLAMVCGLVTAAYAAEGSDQAAASGRAANARMRASCQNNLKQMGIIFKMFANESAGEVFPALSSEAGRLMFGNEKQVYPEYLTDLSVLMCPADKDAGLLDDPAKKEDPASLIDDHSYYYFGYVLKNEEDFKAFAKAYKERIAKGLKFDTDLKVDDRNLLRLREGVERFFITDINDPASAAKVQSEVPVLIERADNHEPKGGNVLFMDGHVDFLKYGDDGKWPMNKAFMETMKALEAVKAPEGSEKKE